MAKVLLVEDDNNLREIYEARLTAEGYEITTAQNGEEALTIANLAKPDLIISDVMMPRVSGFEMLDILRNTDKLRDTKVIMLTALGQAEDRGRADNLGADKYLVKSQVTLEDIVNAAKELLSGAPGSVTAPTAQTAAAAAEEVATPVPAPQTDPAPVEPTPAIPAPVTEPTAEPIVAAAVEPEVIPAPAPVAPAAIVSEPVTADPVVASVPDPASTNATATVTVADPDPIVPQVSPAAQLLSDDDQDDQSDAPVVETTPEITTPEPAAVADVAPVEVPEVEPVAASPVVTPVVAQTIEAEEKAIEDQIAAFAASDDTGTTADSPATAPTTNDTILDDAISKLTGVEATTTDVSPTTEPVTAEPIDTPPSTPLEPRTPATSVDEASGDSSNQIAGRKVIQPLSDIESGTPDLEALLAVEEAKEAAVAAENPKPTVVDAIAPVESEESAVDPNTIAL